MRQFGMITTDHSTAYTEHALGSFLATTELREDDQFLLIDNDGTFKLPAMLSFKQLDIIVNDTPKGFAENMNMVLRRARNRGCAALLLNNDVIFTNRWLQSLESVPEAIVAPLCNRELCYDLPGFKTEVSMTLEQMIPQLGALNRILPFHRQRFPEPNPVITVPFFVVQIPHKIIATVGLLDEAFGRGGGEDYDYCLRAYLSGFDVFYASESYLIHFGGKSSWDGIETHSEQERRERHFFSVFEQKWGVPLTDLILRENAQTLQSQGFQMNHLGPAQIARLVHNAAPTPTPEVVIPA